MSQRLPILCQRKHNNRLKHIEQPPPQHQYLHMPFFFLYFPLFSLISHLPHSFISSNLFLTFSFFFLSKHPILLFFPCSLFLVNTREIMWKDTYYYTINRFSHIGCLKSTVFLPFSHYFTKRCKHLAVYLIMYNCISELWISYPYYSHGALILQNYNICNLQAQFVLKISKLVYKILI